jgi:hypothetical protein
MPISWEQESLKNFCMFKGKNFISKHINAEREKLACVWRDMKRHR